MTMDAVSPILIERAQAPQGLRNMVAVSLVSPSPWNDRPVLVERPLVWLSRCRTVISAEAFASATRNQGR